jgi:hypothetical protein
VRSLLRTHSKSHPIPSLAPLVFFRRLHWRCFMRARIRTHQEMQWLVAQTICKAPSRVASAAQMRLWRNTSASVAKHKLVCGETQARLWRNTSASVAKHKLVCGETQARLWRNTSASVAKHKRVCGEIQAPPKPRALPLGVMAGQRPTAGVACSLALGDQIYELQAKAQSMT